MLYSDATTGSGFPSTAVAGGLLGIKVTPISTETCGWSGSVRSFERVQQNLQTLLCVHPTESKQDRAQTWPGGGDGRRGEARGKEQAALAQGSGEETSREEGEEQQPLTSLRRPEFPVT